MGSGTYSISGSVTRSATYASLNNQQIFTNTAMPHAMSPLNVKVRESRDSAEHPNSFPIIMALDVTGSMGSIPNYMVKEGLNKIMANIIQQGEKDPQVLFLGIGDHECDTSPLQVGQFESSDELLDKWLRAVYLESGGGGNLGESYSLAWYFAGYHTVTDSWEKRKRKGLLFTIGDEPVLPSIPGHALKSFVGGGQYEKKYSAVQLLDKARETYEVYHIHLTQTSAGKLPGAMDGWKQLMGKNLIVVDSAEDVAKTISDIVIKYQGTSHTPTSTYTEDML